MDAHNGADGRQLGPGIGYVIIWAKESLDDRWSSYDMATYLDDNWFPFGSDGGDFFLSFDLRSGNDAIIVMPYIGMGLAEEMGAFSCSFSELADRISHGPMPN